MVTPFFKLTFKLVPLGKRLRSLAVGQTRLEEAHVAVAVGCGLHALTVESTLLEFADQLVSVALCDDAKACVPHHGQVRALAVGKPGFGRRHPGEEAQQDKKNSFHV